MRKISKKVLAAALVLTLALPSAVCLAADEDVEVPDPIAKYTMDDAESMNIIAGAEIVTDAADNGTVLKVSASTDEADSEVAFTNPFAGLDLFEQDVTGDTYTKGADGMPIWYDGVVINYWIKTVDTTNSVILNFRNKNRMQMHKDDYRKYVIASEAKAAYDEAAEKGVSIGEVDARFALSEPVTYVDDNGKEYLVYDQAEEISSKVYWQQFNPDYKDGSYRLNESSGEIEACPKDADPDVDDNWTRISALGDNLYDKFYVWDINENEKSLARYGKADGYFQISLDGGVAFREDTQEGENLNKNTTGNDFNIQNQLIWHGSTPNTPDGESEMKNLLNAENEDTKEVKKWHMVTVVIQNDWIDFYIDGELFEGVEMAYFNYFGSAFSATAAGKSFNAGFGLKGDYQKGVAGRGDYLNGNRSGTLLVEWLALENTTFSIGGVNPHALGRDMAHPERVAEFEIDDIAFYTDLLEEEQIEAIYDKGLEKLNSDDPDIFDKEPEETEGPEKPEVLCGDVDINGIVDANDALAILKHAAQIELLGEEGQAAAHTNSDGVIDAEDALNVLKLAAQMLESLPVD